MWTRFCGGRSPACKPISHRQRSGDQHRRVARHFRPNVKGQAMSKKPRPPSLNALKHGGYFESQPTPREECRQILRTPRPGSALQWRPAGPRKRHRDANRQGAVAREALARISTCPAGRQAVALSAGQQQPARLRPRRGAVAVRQADYGQDVPALKVAKDSVEVQRSCDQGLADFTSLAKEVVEKDRRRYRSDAGPRQPAEVVFVLAGDVITLEKLMRGA